MPTAPPSNLLPADGIVHYFGPILVPSLAANYFRSLFDTIQWVPDEVILFGKRIVTARKVAWYGDDGYRYTYSGTTRQAIPWTTELLSLKQVVERVAGSSFNSCLLNLYHSGNEGMGWHSDDEKMLGKSNIIASVSLGAERKFCFKHKRTHEAISIILENGSLLVMKGETQGNWLHSLPKSKKIHLPRINLTFRTIIAQ